jgi:DNA recombination protein RmuC
VLEAALVLVGLSVGAAAAWVVLRGQVRTARLVEREALGTRLAAAETLGDELRKQLMHRDLEITEVRQTLEHERTQRVQAEARWETARLGVEEQRRLLDEARQRLGETFEALGAEVLRKSGLALLEQARQTIDIQFGRGRETIDGLIKPLQEALDRYETEVRALESARAQAYGSLEEQLRALAATSTDLQRETGNLVSALRSPQVRGRWGEITLHRVVELAGMVEHCDYLEQPTAGADGVRLRPDMIVRLPGGRQIVVDAKVPLAAYLESTAAATPEERRAALVRHAQQVRQHLGLLAGKGYGEDVAQSAELVVMFIPGEAFVAAAVEVDPALLEDGMVKRVVVASPTTLIALLHACAYGWRQERIAANAAQISELGRQLYDRVRTLGRHFDDLGRALKRATDAFNQAVGSMESRVLPAARRFRDLGAATGDDIPLLEPLDQQPRALTAPEFPSQLEAPGIAE